MTIPSSNEREREREVLRVIRHADLRKPDAHRACVLPQRARVPIDCVNLISRSQEFSERERERTTASPQVGPDGARPGDTHAH